MKCLLVRLKLHDGNGGFNQLLLSTAPFDVVLDGDVFVGSGDLLQIEKSESTNEISKTGTTIQLNGIDPVYQADISNGGFIRAPIDILVANVPEGTNVVDMYTFHHRGYCDTPAMELDHETGTLSVGVETNNVFIDIDRVPDLLRCSMATHASRHAGDKFFEYTADVDLEEVWKD